MQRLFVIISQVQLHPQHVIQRTKLSYHIQFTYVLKISKDPPPTLDTIPFKAISAIWKIQLHSYKWDSLFYIKYIAKM